jgi:FimV-like protein
MHSRRRHAAFTASAVLLAIGCRAARKQDPAPSYVNVALCAGCHAAVARSYQQTAMGRSLSLPSPANTFPEEAQSPSYFHAASQSYFTMSRRDGRYFQRRHQTGFDGKPTNEMEKEIHYVMGSGSQARTYLHRTPANKLIELPLSWYAEKGGSWAMSPGFDRPAHPGFRRAISDECMFCHNAYPAEAPDRRGEEAVFPGPLPEGIDCQRCHGPGSEHVRLAQQTSVPGAGIRRAIVNPARLPANRQLELCMQCHLEPTSSRLPDAMVRFGRGPFSYRPGEPLGDFKLYFDHAAEAGRGGKFEIVGAAYRLRQSKCFLRSAGQLLCTTCHSPHSASQRPLAAACRGCHSAALERHPAGEDCASCHMPKRRTEDVVHAVATDHRIQRRPPPNPLAPLAERHETTATAYRGEVKPYYPAPLPSTAANELHVAAAQVMQNSNLDAGVQQLAAAVGRHQPAQAEFYLLLADAWRESGYLERALPVYEEAVRRDPSLVAARLQLGSALRLARSPDRAVEVLEAAIKMAPDRAALWHEAALARLDQGNAGESSGALRKAIALDPDLAEAHDTLAAVLLAGGDNAGAEAAVREAIRIRPEFAGAHKNLGSLLSASGDLVQACRHFEIAIRLEPRLVATRYHYGLALARLQRFDAAQSQLETVLRDEPEHAEAHQAMGALLAGKGQRQAAIRHYREALRLRPGFGRAMLGLAPVLADSGDKNGAVDLLERAVSSGDPGAREQAQAMLRQIRGW